MSIERFADTYTVTCDMCSAELPEEFTFEDAVDSKKQNGLQRNKYEKQRDKLKRMQELLLQNLLLRNNLS